MSDTILLYGLCALSIISIGLSLSLFIRLSKRNNHDEIVALQQQNTLTQAKIDQYLERDYQRDLQSQERFTQFSDKISQDIQRFSQAQNEQFLNFQERLNRLQVALGESLSVYNERLKTALSQDFKSLSEGLEKRLNAIDDKVLENLNQGFNKTNETFTNILLRLGKIDEAQKKIDNLSVEIISLQDVLTDKKSRGTFGEVQLHQILSAVFGEKNDKIYQMQYSFSPSARVDAVLFTPEPLGTISIDSKFPLENYRRMIDKTLTDFERSQAERLFVSDCKKHIDDIASKYIIPEVTANQAFLFLPAEAIFAEIHAYHNDIIEYASKKNVWLTSPTTLMSTLTTIQTILINIERNKYTEVIHQEINKLNSEFKRYRVRWDKLSQHIENVSRDVQEINTTTEKITRRFESISNVDNLPEIETNENKGVLE